MRARLTKKQVKMLIEGHALTNNGRKFRANNEIKSVLQKIDDLETYDLYDILVDTSTNEISINLKDATKERFFTIALVSKEFSDCKTDLNISVGTAISIYEVQAEVEKLLKDFYVEDIREVSMEEYKELERKKEDINSPKNQKIKETSLESNKSFFNKFVKFVDNIKNIASRKREVSKC